MDLELVRTECLSLPATAEGFPFGPEVLVFKVAGKMFATLSIDAIPPRMNLKCRPEDAERLRAEWAGVEPGYHMSKKHWNTVTLDGSIPAAVVSGWIRESWGLVVGTLKKADRERLRSLAG